MSGLDTFSFFLILSVILLCADPVYLPDEEFAFFLIEPLDFGVLTKGGLLKTRC